MRRIEALASKCGNHRVTAKEGIVTEPVRMNVEEVKRMMDSGQPVLFIDTRSPQAWNESDIKLPGALRIHYRELDELPHDRLIITYCT
jgi:rhodanese-related sulfurtransferase